MCFVNKINAYFLSICDDSTYNVTECGLIELLNFDFDDIHFYCKDITPVSVIVSLENMKTEARGVDGESMSFVIETLPVLFQHIFSIINSSLQASVFQEEWKKVLMKPANEIKVPLHAGDHRSIAILCCLSNALERIVYDQIVEYIERNNILSAYQSGYRRGLSTQTLLFKVTDAIGRGIHNRILIIMILIDFSEAFDMVPHIRLLLKRQNYGFSAAVPMWLSS